jgi:uncharacterized protein YdaU (DUF1376 family)
VNYYERHLGDYARDTGHLTMLEHGAYTLLMDRYYAAEQAIPADQAYRLARARSQDERDAVDMVLREFFVLESDGWHQRRCDEEIARYNERQAAGSGKRENEAERQRRHRERRSELFAQLRAAGEVPAYDTPTNELVTLLSRVTGRVRHADTTATQTPDTRHQSPEEDQKTDTGSADANPALPTAIADAKAIRLQQVTQEAVAAYNAVLGKPNGLLASVQLVTPARVKQVKRCVSTARQICQRMYQSPTITAEFWRDYFEAVNADPFRSGRQRGGRGHENWMPDFEYLTRYDVMAAVFDRAMSEGDGAEAAA